MKNVAIEIPKNRKELFEELAGWEPAQMKKDFDNLIYYFAIMGANENSTKELSFDVAFTPDELYNLLFRLKGVSESLAV